MKSRLLLVAVLTLSPLLLAAQGEPSLTVTLGVVGETETEVTVDGAGFRPNRPVELRIISTAGFSLVVPVDPDSDGAFTVTVSLRRFSSYVVEGWQQQGNHFVLKARVVFLVPGESG